MKFRHNIFRFFQSIVVGLILCFSIYGAPPEWFIKLKQIKILESTRQEIETLFNHPKITYESVGQETVSVEYALKQGELYVSYSLGKCSEQSEYSYDVEKDVVTRVDIDLKKHINISKLGLDLNGFKKSGISDLPGIFTYRNEDLGEYHQTGEYFKNGVVKVKNLEFFPSSSKQKLACSNM